MRAGLEFSPQVNHRLRDKVLSGERLSLEEGIALYDVDLFTLGEWARGRMQSDKRDEGIVTFVVDRNIAYTNICYVDCDYCAFYRHKDAPDAYTLSDDEIFRRIEELVKIGGTQVMLQGGVNPQLPLSYYINLMKKIKARFPVHLHSFTSTEIAFIARISRLTVEETLKQMKEAGLDSIPGGGAEMLDDGVRDKISPKKQTAAEWLAFHETAHRVGLFTTATMMYGHVETLSHRIEHMLKIRSLQDRTGGFTAFISWTFSPTNTRMDRIRMASGQEYLKTLAISRIVLDNIPHFQTGWVTEGKKIWQLALFFGVDDMGGVLMQEEVVKSTGLAYGTTTQELVALIRGAGKIPVQRNTRYEHLKTF